MDTISTLNQADLDEFKAAWLRADQAWKSCRDYLNHLQRYFRQYDKLGLPEARKFVDSYESKHTAKFAARSLKAFSKWYAKEYEVLDILKKMDVPKVPEPTNLTVMTTEMFKAIMETCRGGTGQEGWLNIRDAAILMTMAVTGMRRSEVARIKLDDLDLKEGTIFVPKTKSKRARTVTLTEEALKFIKRWLHASDHTMRDALWLRKRGPAMSSEDIRVMFAERAKRAGVYVTPHGCRRGLAVQWLAKAGSEAYLLAQMGWTSVQMIVTYTKLVAGAESVQEHRRLFFKDGVYA